jgi:hypothetical protein
VKRRRSSGSPGQMGMPSRSGMVRSIRDIVPPPQVIPVSGSGKILIGKTRCGPLGEIALRSSEYLDLAKYIVLCLINERMNTFDFNYFYRITEIWESDERDV